MEVFSNNDHWQAERQGIVQRLLEEVGETCIVLMPSGSEMIYVDQVGLHGPFRIQLNKNDRVPIYHTASGKLFSNNLTSIKRSRLLTKLHFENFTGNTLTDVTSLK